MIDRNAMITTEMLMLLGPIPLWCMFILVREKGMEALSIAYRRITIFAIGLLIPLIFDLISSQTSESGANAFKNILLWAAIAASICMSMVFAVILMTLFRERESLRQMFKQGGDHA